MLMNFGTTSTIVHAYFGVYLFSPCFRWHLTAFYGSVCSFCSQFDLDGLNKDTFIEYGYNCHYFVNWFFSYFVRVMYWKEFITFENSGAVKLGYSWFELARIFNILPSSYRTRNQLRMEATLKIKIIPLLCGYFIFKRTSLQSNGKKD